MNIANELDIEMDAAIKRHIAKLFDAYFSSKEAPETKTNQLKSAVKLLEGDIEIATKALEDL